MVGSAFYSCARGFSFFLIDRASRCFQQVTWFGIRRATPSRYGTINPIDMSKTESPKFTVSVKAATGWPLLRALVNRDVVAPRRPNVQLARTPNLLTWILDHFLPLRDPAGGARHRE